MFFGLVLYEMHECGIDTGRIDEHGMRFVLGRQEDDAGTGTFDCKHLSIFYVLEHIARFYHGLSSRGYNLSGITDAADFLLISTG